MLGTILYVLLDVSLNTAIWATKTISSGIYNGYNSSNRTIANYSWFIKSILPEFLGGFSLNILRNQKNSSKFK